MAACFVPCTPALQCAFSCGGNAKVALFVLNPNVDDCLYPDNPMMASNDLITRIWEGTAVVGASVPARQDRRAEGRIETQNREVTIATNPLDIPTGAWMFIQIAGDVLGGEVEAVSRDIPNIAVLSVNMAKPVPFSTELAQVPPWVRGVQV